MNAAFLVLTTAWLAGADAAAPPPPKNPAPAAAPVGSCSGSCGACCDEGCGRRFFHRCRERCNRCRDHVRRCRSHDTCHDTCDTGCEREGCFARLKARFHRCNQCEGACGTSCDDCGRGRLFGRLRDLFHRHNDCDDCCGSATPARGGPESIGPPREQPKKMPSSEPPKVGAITPSLEVTPVIAPKSNLPIETETKSPFELHRRYESRVDHAPDYSWLTGQLFYVHADGGLWVLRYAPLWKEDPNGGSVVLARDLHMDDYHEGDLVTVHGEILSPRSSVFLGGPLYRASKISLVDRLSQ